MADLRIDIASEFTGAKAFKKAETASQKLEKGVGRLGKTLLASFGAAKVLQFGKASAKAFMEDEKAATKLAQSVKNLGLAYANDDIRKYIDKLTLATGVADSELRPALQSLLQVTGSVTKSQELLGSAIDISRGSGEDLATVSNDLSQAYVGNLKGLRKYNLGLTQAELKSSSFEDVQKRLNTLFAGSSTAYLATYSGQMQLLSTAASEAQEIIGKDLVDALVLASGQEGVQGLADQMNSLATYTGNVVYGIGVLLDKLNNSKIVKGIGGFNVEMIPIIGGWIGALEGLGSSAKAAKNAFNFGVGGGAGAGSTTSMNASAAARAEAAAKKRQLELLGVQKKQLKATKDQVALQKAGTIFDVTQAGILAALKGDISKEERKRLELQLAILTGNTGEASKLAGEIATAQGLSKDLANYLRDLPDAKNPFKSWADYLNMLEAQVKRIATVQPGSQASMGIPTINGAAIDAITATYGTGSISNRADASGNVNVYVGGSVISESDLVEAVSNGLLNRSLSGSQSAIGRLKGSFAG